MQSELHSVETRTVYGDKVTRVTLDIPYESAEDEDVDGDDFIKWLNNNVGSDIFTALGPFGDERQSVLGGGAVTGSSDTGWKPDDPDHRPDGTEGL